MKALPAAPLVLAHGLLALSVLLAAPSVQADDERLRIAAERQSLTERFAAEEAACRTRFAVNACLDDLRARRRAALAPLRERELRLSEAERRRRAAERQAAIEERRRSAAQRPPAPPELRLREPVPAAPAPNRGAVSAPSAAKENDDREARAAQRVRAAAQRERDAGAAQERVQRRQAERAAAGKTSAPLPAPRAASGPGR